jgi:Mg-chelatase subunit ChlD
VLESVQPDVHLVATLLALRAAIPEHSRETARAVVRKVVGQLEARLGMQTRQAVTGALHRAGRSRRPRGGDIDWNRTILANLKRYQPEHRTVIPEVLVGYGRRTPRVVRDVIVAVDQSGSMASSVVYASVFASVLASVRSLATRVIVFDTEVVDLTDHVDDPVDLLFGVQLGGGTDINRAVAYCAEQVRQPRATILVLISDLFEGGDAAEMVARLAALHGDGVQVVALLALADDGAPAYDHELAGELAAFGVPVFACTPDQFPDLMATAIERRDIATWAAGHEITLAQP